MHSGVCVCVCVSVDDGSGVLNCTQWRRSKDSSDGLYVPEIGELVSVLGQVEEYREEKQFRVTAIGAQPTYTSCIMTYIIAYIYIAIYM